MSDRIIVTGVGVVSPFGDEPAAFRDALLAGASAIAADQRFVDYGCRSRLAARVARFDPARWISPMKLRRMDTTGPYALVSLQQAMKAAGYEAGAAPDDRTGVLLGTYSAGGQSTNEYLEALFRGGPTGAPALLFSSTVGNAAAGLAGLEFKLAGPNATISQKEASGLAAIAVATDLLRLGRADAVGAGGMDAIYDIFYRAHDRFRAMTDAAAPDESQAPFARARRGFVMGEGGFALWLERGSAGDPRALAEILGVSQSGAAAPLNGWPADSAPLARSMRLALEDARLAPADVSTVYASANATASLDDVEARALTEVFGGRPAVTSIKGAIGESGAAGAAACAAAILCGRLGEVPPIAGLRDVADSASGLRLCTSRTAAGEVVMVNSVGSGGALASLVLRVPRGEA